MRHPFLALVLVACASAPRPAVIEAEVPVAERSLCSIHPAQRADGLLELRGNETEIELGDCIDPRDRFHALLWALQPDRMAVSEPGADWTSFREPIAVHDQDGVRAVDVMSETLDRRCVPAGEAAGEVVPIDLPDQAIPTWIGLEETDMPLRLDYHYTTGGCTFERAGDLTIIELPDAAGEVADEAMVSRGDARGIDYAVRGDVLLVVAPYRESGRCVGSSPDVVDENPGVSPRKQSVMVRLPFRYSRIVVPATAARVIVRPQLFLEPPCS